MILFASLPSEPSANHIFLLVGCPALILMADLPERWLRKVGVSVPVSGIKATMNSSTQFSVVCHVLWQNFTHRTSFKFGISPLKSYWCPITEFALHAKSAVLALQGREEDGNSREYFLPGFFKIYCLRISYTNNVFSSNPPSTPLTSLYLPAIFPSQLDKLILNPPSPFSVVIMSTVSSVGIQAVYWTATSLK